MKQVHSIPVVELEELLNFVFKDKYSSADNPTQKFLQKLEAFDKSAIGPYYWIMADVQRAHNFACGESVEQLIPLRKDDIPKTSLEDLSLIIHPEDREQYPALVQKMLEYVILHKDYDCDRFKSVIYIRQQDPQREYRWMMIQYIAYQFSEAGVMQYLLGVATDLSHIKQEGEASLTVYDKQENQTHIYHVRKQQAFEQAAMHTPSFTRQELKVLGLIANGLSSKEIAAQLHLSVRTIDNHRQNMLKKSDARSALELVTYGLRAGIL